MQKTRVDEMANPNKVTKYNVVIKSHWIWMHDIFYKSLSAG